MNIVVISKWFPTPYAPNSGVFVLEQIKALRLLGVEVVRIIAPTPWAPRWLRFLSRIQKYEGIPCRSVQQGFQVEHPRVINFPGDRFFFLYGLLFYLRCRPIIRKLIKDHNIDVIHAHTIMPEGFAAVLLGREFRLPVVCTSHGGDINDLLPPFRLRSKKRLALAAVKWALRNIRHLITVSGDLKKKVEALGESQTINVTVARNGADCDIFQPVNKKVAREKLGLPLDKQIIVFIGGLVSDKGLPFLLEAFARLQGRQAQLYVVGSGNKEEQLRAQARSLGIEATSIFSGRRPHSEVPLWLSSCDCFVLSSVTEGSPTIISEAMLCRAPIVATAVGGVPELVRDGKTGLLVPSRNIAALAEALAFMLNNREAADRMAFAAEIHARKNLTWDCNARTTLEIYRAAAADRRSSDAALGLDCLPQS